jgi:20S proteasome alpha/beta subunit
MIWQFGFIVLLLLIVVSGFDSNGLIPQMDLAFKASNNGGTIIAAKAKDIAVMILYRKKENGENIKESSRVKIINKKLIVGLSGISSDGLHLSNILFDRCIEYESIYGTIMPISRCANLMSQTLHERTLSTQSRPLGIRLCLMGYNDNKISPSIVDIDPLGNFHESSICCVGPYANKIIELFKENSSIKRQQKDKNNNGIGSDRIKCVELIKKCVGKLRICLSDDNVIVDTEDIVICVLGKSIDARILSKKSVNYVMQQIDDNADVLNEETLCRIFDERE